MKPLSLLLTLSLYALAADVWQSKPYTEWSDKDVQKLLTNSPWSKEVSVVIAGRDSGEGSSKGGGKRGGGGGEPTGDTPLTGPATSNGGSNANGKAGIQEMGTPGGGGNAPALTLIVRWQTALPIREAVVKQKPDAATSPDAKKMLEEAPQFYAITVSGLPGRMAHGGDQMKAALLENTTLSVKGKDPIVAKDVQMGGNEKAAVLMFIFPKTAPIDADDKEVEFSSKFGPMMVKQKFKLKDMMFNGKLEL